MRKAMCSYGWVIGVGLLFPVLVTAVPRAVSIDAGFYHTCATLDNGLTKCWGRNESGQLGVGDTEFRGDDPGEMGDNLPYVELGEGGKGARVRAGGYHTCALFLDGRIKCWGDNQDGTLGIGDDQNRGGKEDEMGKMLPEVQLGGKAVFLATGGWHNCAILHQGELKCWGFNTFGQLGLGDTMSRGVYRWELGDDLPAVNLGGRAVHVAAGGWHTCVVLDTGEVKCFGSNRDGRLGLGDEIFRGWEPEDMGAALPPVDLGSGVGASAVHAAMGGWSTCALLRDKSVKCWGDNTFGQLGLGDDAPRGLSPSHMGDALPAVSLAGVKVAMLLASDSETCVLSEGDGAIKCWGSNQHGQLGQGDILSRGDNPGEMGDQLPAVDLGGRPAVDMAAGDWHTCAILRDDGQVVCWGSGVFGQLGTGNQITVGTMPSDMALALVPVSLSGGRKASVDVRVVVIALTVPLGLAMVVLHTIYVYLKRQESIKEQARIQMRTGQDANEIPSTRVSHHFGNDDSPYVGVEAPQRQSMGLGGQRDDVEESESPQRQSMGLGGQRVAWGGAGDHREGEGQEDGVSGARVEWQGGRGSWGGDEEV